MYHSNGIDLSIICSRFKIFLDANSLSIQRPEKFFIDKMKKNLLINNSKMIIPKIALKHQQHSTLSFVDRLIKEKLLEIRGQSNDPEQLRDLFFSIFSKFRQQYNLCLITQNKETAVGLINKFSNYGYNHNEILILKIETNNYSLKDWQDIFKSGDSPFDINGTPLPPGVKTISDIENEIDPGIKLINASILLEYLLTSINEDLKSKSGRPMMLGERVEYYENLFTNVKKIKNALQIRNAIVHAKTECNFTIQDIKIAAQNLLYGINKLLKHVSKQLSKKILNNQSVRIKEPPMHYNQYTNKDNFYTGLDTNQNWTRKWKHVIPVKSDKDQMTGYQCVQIKKNNDTRNETLWNRVKKYFGDSDKDKERFNFLVRVTTANSVLLEPKAFRTCQAGEPPKIGFKFLFSTQSIDKIIRSFMDDPMRQIVEEMLEKVKRDCEQIKNSELYEKREVWEQHLPSIGNDFSEKFDFGIFVESVRVDLSISKDILLKDEIEIKQKELDYEKEIARIDFERDSHRSECNNKRLTNEDKNRNLRDRINLIDQKKTELEIEKVEDEIKHLNANREHAHKYKDEMLNIYFEKIRNGEINFDESSLKRPTNGIRQDSDYSQITQSFGISNLNSNDKMLESTTHTITSSNDKRDRAWENIDLQTRRLPVVAEAFIPLKVKMGDTVNIIVSLQKTDKFNDENHHDIAESWSARIITTQILQGNDPLKKFKYNKKEEAYECKFEVSWNSYLYEVELEILDEDNESKGKISSMPNSID
ncbi:hypothetical protein MHK_010684 [Candidatus Magnetomorum sp. HK-1]|nr:hypothetical protein MHK_010684 [Candidatus Magnetomorum sp. HK-1]